MSINELPEECLLIIFDLINELDDLLNCYKVCSKWSHLIEERTRKVKYLVDYQDYGYSYTFDYVYYRTEEPIDGTCLNALFPNLKIGNFDWKLREKVDHEDIVTFVKKNKSLKGIIDRFHRDKSVFQYCDNLEMVSSNYFETCMANNGASIKQLLLSRYLLDQFTTDAHYFPNLERLHICNEKDYPDWAYDGPILSRLKIFELSLVNYEADCGFHFMDSCPNLQSAHIRLYSNRIAVDESLKHESLQDLVLQFCTRSNIRSHNWNLKSKILLMKYPNLKHLALRSNQSLENRGVLQLLNILPNLVLLDVRGCPKVTQKAADYIQDYNKQNGRAIKFYFDGNHQEIQSDWLQLSSKREIISQGFDFMKHCFLKDFDDLPTFLIPSED